jgi:UPF0755 protein
MFKKNSIKVSIFIGISLFIIMFTFYFYQVFFSPNILVAKSEGELLIPKGATIRNVLDSLQHREYLEDAVSFMFVTKITGYQDNIRPGRYVFAKKTGQKGLTNLEFVRMIRSGAQAPVNVTFNNVRLKSELAARLCRNTVADPQEFQQLINNPEFVATLGFDTISIATMFIPNTYQVYWTTDARGLIERMKREYDLFWNEKRRVRAQEIGLTPVEVSVLASIVQAETQKNDEKPIVAGLYMNRLAKNMTLGADPTLIFALQDFTIKRVLDKDKQVESPYNTYKYTGLPPGPINIPEPSSLEAVLNYEPHNYLYMCAKEDFSGYHRFAVTYDQHLANARKYQRALNQAGIRR